MLGHSVTRDAIILTHTMLIADSQFMAAVFDESGILPTDPGQLLYNSVPWSQTVSAAMSSRFTT